MSKIKENFLPIILFLFLVLLYTLPLYKNEFYRSHDGENHVARIGAYVKAFNDFQTPIRWAGDLNYSYGSPVLMFFYPLPGIISIPISYFTSLENTFKTLIIFSFCLSFISFYLLVKYLYKDTLLALIGGSIYGLVPYHFLNLYIRGDVGELLALGFIPLVFLLIERSNSKKDFVSVALGAVFYALVILSHNGISLLFSPIILLYILFRSKKVNLIKNYIVIILGLSLSAYFWIPAMIESKYTNANLFIGNMFRDHFPSFEKLVFSNWGFGSNINSTGGLSPQIGFINLILTIGSIIIYFKIKERSEKKVLIFWFLIFLSFLFLTLSESSPLWSSLPLISKLQFPWRLVGVLSFATSMLSVIFLKYMPNNVKFLVMIAVLLYSTQFLKIDYLQSKPDKYYFDFKGTTYYHGEASPIWTAGDFYSFPDNHYEIISGDARIVDNIRRSNYHKIIVEANTDTRIVDNTIYFPGWQVFINNEKVPIEFQDQNWRGLITFNIPPGRHNIEIKFGESPIRILADAISLISVLLIIVTLLFRQKIYVLFKRK